MMKIITTEKYILLMIKEKNELMLTVSFVNEGYDDNVFHKEMKVKVDVTEKEIQELIDSFLIACKI